MDDLSENNEEAAISNCCTGKGLKHKIEKKIKKTNSLRFIFLMSLQEEKFISLTGCNSMINLHCSIIIAVYFTSQHCN